jgi:hypothetical protein
VASQPLGFGVETDRRIDPPVKIFVLLPQGIFRNSGLFPRSMSAIAIFRQLSRLATPCPRPLRRQQLTHCTFSMSGSGQLLSK